MSLLTKDGERMIAENIATLNKEYGFRLGYAAACRALAVCEFGDYVVGVSRRPLAEVLKEIEMMHVNLEYPCCPVDSASSVHAASIPSCGAATRTMPA